MVKKYGIKDFVLSNKNIQYTSPKSFVANHTGDTADVGTRNHPEVASIELQVKVKMEITAYGPAGIIGQDMSRDYNMRKRLESGSIYNFACKEQYDTDSVVLPDGQVHKGKTRVGNVDISVTLMEVKLTNGNLGGIEGGAGPEGDPTDFWAMYGKYIVDGMTWIVGITAVFMCGYMVYRIYRWKKHGDKLFPHLGGGQ